MQISESELVGCGGPLGLHFSQPPRGQRCENEAQADQVGSTTAAQAEDDSAQLGRDSALEGSRNFEEVESKRADDQMWLSGFPS